MPKNKLTLCPDDQRAVDAILNHASATQPISARQVAPPSSINAVTKILSLLENIPAIEPPAGLLDRTMQRIEDINTRKISHRSTRYSPRTFDHSIHFH